MSDAFRFDTQDGRRPRAVMVAVQLPGVSDAELASSLAELRRLAQTLGLDVVGQVSQRRKSLAAGKVLGDGKLRELARWTGGSGQVLHYEKPGRKRKKQDDDDGADGEHEPEHEHEHEHEPELADGDSIADTEALPPEHEATVVLVDHDLTPTQQRNLERATDAEVHDRTSVIIGIFHRHARSREARLQVEIARLTYLAPRLRESGGGDRVRGGIGGKGAGESALELDRRRARDRIAELRRELASIDGTAQVQRGGRDHLPTVALVGYTNAGKSSLMRALTGSEVYVADKLFATLDTTVRVLAPRTDPPILLSDTVGFVKKLPHDLVASFRSTLREATEADLVIQVVDASDSALRDHIRVTREVLGELAPLRRIWTEPDVGDASSASREEGAYSPYETDEQRRDAQRIRRQATGRSDAVAAASGGRTVWMALNKIDRVDTDARSALALEFPDAMLMSAKDGGDVAALREQILLHFLGELEDAELVVPWAEHGRVFHQIREQCRVVSETHDEHGTRVTVRGVRSVIDRLRAQLV